MGLASTAAAVTLPAPLRNNTPVTGNAADFTNDARFQNGDVDANSGNGIQPGFVANKYSITPLDPDGAGPATSNNVLPQLTRALVQFQAGSATQSIATNQTYGVFVPTNATGLPVSAGGTGTHTSLLTGTTLLANSSSISTLNQINQPWQNFQQTNGADQVNMPAPVIFSIARAGSLLTVKVGDASSVAQWDHVWTSTSTGFTDIDGLSIRLRTSIGTFRLTDLRYNGDLLDSTTTSGPTSTYQADVLSAGNTFAPVNNTSTEIFLWDKVAGDFTLTGSLFLGWTGTRPTSAQSTVQIRLLDLPAEPIPEPASWAMMIAGFGLVGASLRRRRRALAA